MLQMDVPVDAMMLFTEILILILQAVAFVTFFTHEAALSAMTSLNVS